MSKTYYPEVQPNPEFPAIEEAVLAYWQKEGLFKKSVENRKDAHEFIFYDGPPFANGLPHYGHLLTGFVKDLFARYQTMKGKRVERRFGWDCHGLPAEMGSEKELGISGRQAIMKFGIGKFNEHCRTSVMKYTKEWEHYVTRQARWVDFKGDYKTMDINFMESVLWAFKQIYDKGWVYEAYRVMPYSWAAETPLSNFETKLDNSYREREDKAITVAFELKEAPKGAPKADKYYVLAWTTTPWTLPSNLALAANENDVSYEYFIEKSTGNIYIASAFWIRNHKGQKEFADKYIFEDEHGTMPLPDGALLGLSYHPLFPYFKNAENAFRILDGSSFVTDADGTGIVHMAPGFGEDDQKCCEANGIEVVVPVDGQGRFTDEIYDIKYPLTPTLSPNGGEDAKQSLSLSEGEGSEHRRAGEGVLSLKGLNVIAEKNKSEGDPFNEKQIEKYGLANLRIIRYLKNYPDGTNRVIKEEEFKHNYPHCWRTDTPLIYRAMPSWYVEVTKFRDRAVELNQQINWIPAHIRDGQMGHMLATAPDWSISRNRFWGTPIPVWRSKSGKVKVCGSIAEIEKLSGKKVTDLHRPFIDEITFTIDGEEYRRVEDVFDCWFESGSMPFAQVHYPFENKEWFESHFPADFITEYVGQTRGWFNTLIMLATALFDKPPFKNCICHGVVLDAETGLKYSKRLKNYKDPLEVIDQFGADALRWLMVASPVMRGQDLMVDPEGKFIRDVVRLAIKPIWNAYNFFCLYANADGVKAKLIHPHPPADAGPSLSLNEGEGRGEGDNNVMDRYILAKCRQAVETIEKSLDAYDVPSACDALQQFFEALNNWYIRRNKERFWSENIEADPSSPDGLRRTSKQAAYDTLYTVLTVMCRAAAPLLPLTLEEIYRGLTGEESVHTADFPSVTPAQAGVHNHGLWNMDSRLRGNDEDVLVVEMDRVRDICTSALSIRNQQNIRVRQPLRKLDVVGYHLDKLYKYSDLIKDELNVKEVVIHHPEEMANYGIFKLQIIFPELGKRLKAEGKENKMKEITAAAKSGQWKKTAAGQREVAGEILMTSEYKQLLEPKKDYAKNSAALSTNDAIVVLDLTVTPELEAEGIARDVVRMIQQARKDASLNVSDRIRLHLDAPESIIKAVSLHKSYIMEQTLAVEISDKKPDNALSFGNANAIDDQPVTISLVRAA